MPIRSEEPNEIDRDMLAANLSGPLVSGVLGGVGMVLG